MINYFCTFVYLYIPIIIPAGHWFFGAMELKTLKITIYDSHRKSEYFSEKDQFL